MRTMPKRRIAVAILAMFGMALSAWPINAAASFASPAFQQQWQTSEATLANFWGPLATARDGKMEQYAQAAGSQRLVQYFDKGRMELGSNGTVTNGLLAKELITGKMQYGDNLFEAHVPAPIPIAGDLNNSGPTYAQLATKAAGVLVPVSDRKGGRITFAISPNGDLTTSEPQSTQGPAFLTAYDAATKHNIPTAFAAYRDYVGVAAIGLALSEPFRATVKVEGQPRDLIIQVFERRVLTYYADATDEYRIEFANIGQHYYHWRYELKPAAIVTPTVTATAAATTPPATAVPTAIPLANPIPVIATPTSPDRTP